MSVRAINWAIALRGVSGAQKSVLFVLAYHHNDKSGRCYPSAETIAVEAGLSIRATRKAIADMARAGLIRIINRTASGKKLSNEYHLFDAKKAVAKPGLDVHDGSNLVVHVVHVSRPAPRAHKHEEIPLYLTEAKTEPAKASLRVLDGCRNA